MAYSYSGATVDKDDDLQSLLRLCREKLRGTPVILAAALTLEKAQALIDSGLIDLAAFGQPFMANPDCVARLKNGWPLTEPDRSTF